jgi:hypothetical protein
MNEFYASSPPNGKSAFKPITSSSKSVSIEFSSSQSSPFQSINGLRTNLITKKFEQKAPVLTTAKPTIKSKRLIRSKSLNDLDSKKILIKTIRRNASLQNLKSSPCKNRRNDAKCDFMKNNFDLQLTKIDLQFKISTYVKTIETKNLNNKLSKYLNHKKDSLVSCTNTNTSISTFGHQVKELNKFPCSNSLVDLLITILRFKDSTESLIDLLIPVEMVKENFKFFQAKFTCINNIYQV